MLIKGTSEIGQEAGLNNVDSVGITEVLKSNSLPLSNEEISDLAQQLTEQQKEHEDDRATKVIHLKDLTDILSA